jgi:hypothetical protein
MKKKNSVICPRSILTNYDNTAFRFYCFAKIKYNYIVLEHDQIYSDTLNQTHWTKHNKAYELNVMLQKQQIKYNSHSA